MTSRTRLIGILVSAPVIAFTVIGGLLAHAMARTDETLATLRVFHDVVSLIMSNYVEQPNMESVMRGAMRGLAEGLDSDSAYLTQPQVRQVEGGEQPGAADVGIDPDPSGPTSESSRCATTRRRPKQASDPATSFALSTRGPRATCRRSRGNASSRECQDRRSS